jgi:hypothetical protein
MTWYAAHIVMQIAVNGRKDVVAWENIVLVQASTVEEAYDKADEIGREGEGDANGTLMLEGDPARMVYRGTRRLVTLSSPTDNENSPTDGCEISYLQVKLESENALNEFMEGDGPAQLVE